MKRAQNANMVVVKFFSLQISEYSSSKIMSYYIVLACATTATIGHYQAFGYLQCYLCQYCQHLPQLLFFKEFMHYTSSLTILQCHICSILAPNLQPRFPFQDQNHYNAGRGAHINLKRAEKARTLVSKLPCKLYTCSYFILLLKNI